MRALVRLLLTAAMATAAMAGMDAADEALRFTIDDNFPPLVGSIRPAGVFSDGNPAYQDWRLDPPDDFTNWCVSAAPAPPGNLFLQFNRKLDGLGGTLRCTENPRPDGLYGESRQFVLRINNNDACTILWTAPAGLMLWDQYEQPWVSGAGPCTIRESSSPRMRLGTLYKPKASATNIDFLTYVDGSTSSFEVRSDNNATIQTSGAAKTVTYSGTFHLVRFDPGVKAKTVGPPFTMPVRMTFTMP